MAWIKMEALEILSRKIKTVEDLVFLIVSDYVHDLKENSEVFGVIPVRFIFETKYFHAGKSRSPRHLEGILMEFGEFFKTNRSKISLHPFYNTFQGFLGKAEAENDWLKLLKKVVFGFAMEGIL